MSDIWAVVQRRGNTWTGRMVKARGLEQPRVAFTGEHTPGSLPLGSQVDLGLATRKMHRAARSGALLCGVDWTDRAVELTLEPDEPELFAQAIPGLFTDPPERRANVRVFPRTGDGITVPVRLAEDMAAKPYSARLCDASAGGLGLLFPYAAEEMLCFSRTFLCEMSGPAGERQEIECRVKNRTLLEDGVRYGVEFTAGAAASVLAFEPLWDCTCGETGLLAASHPRCLRCGRPRSTATRLPHRDGILSLTAHVYTGKDRFCPSCKATWSAIAKFCGRCGLQLAKDA